MVAQVALSHNDKNDCRDAKDDSYTEGLIVNWEIFGEGNPQQRTFSANALLWAA
jgi:hypothetical protein